MALARFISGTYCVFDAAVFRRGLAGRQLPASRRTAPVTFPARRHQMLGATSGAASHSSDERNRKQNQENKEQDPGDAGGRRGDAKKAKNRSNKSDNEKC